MNKTTEKLIKFLTKEHASEEMLRKAEDMQYDDFLSDSPFPITDLVKDARKERLFKIVNMAIDGEFDATKEEADAWAASEEGKEEADAWGASEEGQSTFNELIRSSSGDRKEG